MTILNLRKRPNGPLQWRAKTVLQVVGVILLALGLTITGYILWLFNQVLVIQNILGLEWKQLKASEAVFAHGPVPTGWQGGAFISGDSINQVLKMQAGSKIKVAGLSSLSDLEVELNSIEVETQVGVPEVRISLTARSATNNLRVDLEADGVLGFEGLGLSAETVPRPVVKFAVGLATVKPVLAWSSLSLTSPDAMKQIIAAGLMLKVQERLRFQAPVSETVVLPLGDAPKPGREQFKITKEKIEIKETGGTVDMEMRQANVDLVLKLNFATPLFTPQGVWLLATDKPFSPPNIQAPMDLTDSQVNALRVSVAKLHMATSKPDGDIIVFINKSAMKSLVSQLKDLSPEQRTLHGKSVGYTKEIHSTIWQADGLGEGGLQVKAQKPDFAAISAVVSSPDSEWSGESGLKITTNTQLKAHAHLHWHFGVPGLGGGVGSDITVNAESAVPVPINGTLELVLDQVGGRPTALLVPSLTCVNAPLELKETGELKLTVKTSLRLFDKPMAPVTLLGFSPITLAFPGAQEVPAEKATEGDGVKVSASWRYPAVDAMVVPSKVATTEDGFYIVGKLTSLIPVVKDHEAGEKARADARRDQLGAYVKAMPQPTCPEKSDLRVSIVGMEIGPNGEIIKAVREAFALAQRTQDEAKKILTKPVDALVDAPGNVAREAAEAAEAARKALEEAGKKIDPRNWKL